ncbi:MAG: PQQ-like beta-propeller repeat protein [Pirellulales bacterium]|nr:PQQ-like beta-propeller repeat protein [Pirellulales bacterium]
MSYSSSGSHKTKILFVISAAILCPLENSGLSKDQWNQFRGPKGDGTSTVKQLPESFDEEVNVTWKTRVSGTGWSSPVIWEDDIWISSGDAASKELRAICVSFETGKITKNIKVFDMVPRPRDPAYKYDSPHLNSPATPTPVVEEDRLFISYGSQGIACIDRKSGATLWKRRDLRIYQPVRQGSSPIVDTDTLYVAFDGTDQQYFIALYKSTGDTKWKAKREIDTDWAKTLATKGFSPKGGGKPNDNKKSFATNRARRRSNYLV